MIFPFVSRDRSHDEND